MEYKCEYCKYDIKVEYPNIIHAGFNDSGFMYCNKCGDLLTWNSYDKNYTKIIGEKHPWMLNTKEKKIIEESVIKCDCGGCFQFSAKPRCPNCKKEIPNILPDDIHFIVLRKRIDASERKIWIK